jgi:hypothetical protein
MNASQPKIVTTIVIVLVSTLSLCQEATESSKRYVPPEFQPSDAEVKALIDSATESAANGKYSERTQSLQKALARCEEKGFSDVHNVGCSLRNHLEYQQGFH